MANVAHQLIMGHRLDGTLLWAPDEKHLYFKKKSLKNGNEDWICYQEMLLKQKGKPQGEHTSDLTKCTSRILRNPAIQTCQRKKVAHTDHENHEKIYKDLVSRHNIYRDTVRLRDATAGLSMNVPVNDIFTRELAKWVDIYILYIWCRCLIVQSSCEIVLCNSLLYVSNKYIIYVYVHPTICFLLQEDHVEEPHFHSFHFGIIFIHLKTSVGWIETAVQ